MIARRSLLGALGLAPLAAPAFAQSSPFPAGAPARLIVPFAPGGATDVIARVLADELARAWGTGVLVENRAGAGSNLGAEAAARAEPDGRTLLVASVGMAINRFIYERPGYDAQADFAPVSLLCLVPNLMAVPVSSPATSVAGFVAHAKANPGRISYGSSGVGTSLHLSGELFKRLAGIEMTHVPYRGAAPAMTDLIGGRLDVMFDNITSILPQVQGGTLRGLAVTGARRSPAAPDLPTVAEAGVAGFDVSSWFALFAPVKTPPDLVARLSADTAAALRRPEAASKLAALGAGVVAGPPEALAAHLKAETDRWGPIIRAAGIGVQ